LRKTKYKLLLVDDEPDILEFLQYNLENDGYQVETATNGDMAIEKAISFNPDLVLLDIMMPGKDGIEVCQELRNLSQFKKTVIAFLTARSESFTEIMALDNGGDDFIQKPIKPSVLKSRIKALLRRALNEDENNLSEEKFLFDDIEIDFEKVTVIKNGSEIHIAKKEFELISLLVSNPGKVFKRSEIMNKIWGDGVIVGDRTIDVHVRKLREKLGSNYIQTMKGIGYKFNL